METDKKFRKGDRVRYTGSPLLGPPYGSLGTVSEVAGVRGKSIHPDPSKIMTFVTWDERTPEGVFTKQLEKVK